MECPHCGAPVPKRAKACPECGSDDRTGWASEEEIGYAGVDIPDAYDPDEWEREGERRNTSQGRRFWIILAMVAGFIVAFALTR